uniref:Tripartite motif-containing protein 16-like n=1 Tax=Seriola dumerili TaxID=41447 RepID=A0A3B4TVZ5_SERDU
MAQRGNQLDQERFCCSICLDLLKDPVTIPCGHSYCINCIKTHWDEGDQKKIHSCPQCRKTFTQRPVMVTSTMLADLMEELKKTGLQAAPADHCYAGPEDVACDFCTGRKLKAFQVLSVICYLCSVDEHKGHDTVSAAAERTERQRELQLRRQQIQQRIQDRDKDVKVLQQEVELSMALLIKQWRTVRRSSLIESQELQEKLEQEITELKRKDAELKQLSHTEDHNQFLHKHTPHCHDSVNLQTHPLLSQLRDKLQDILRDTWTNISLTVTESDVHLSQPEPRTRADFLKHSQEITLDPNTANTYLLLSGGNRKATLMSQQQFYSSHTVRFTSCWQVLSRESLTGRCYWEVEWRGKVFVAVAYKNISRAGSESGFGHNDKSWALNCNQNGYTFFYNNINTPVSGPRSSRVGVYLDHSAGVLSFYNVSKTMTLLHRVQTTFTQPLYAGLWLSSLCVYGHTAELCKLK